MNFVDKFYWGMDHPKLGGCIPAQIELQPQMIDPSLGVVNLDNPELNTQQEWWIEVFALGNEYDKALSHYWELDCGGYTAEDAVNTLYDLVLEKYGNY